MESFLSQAGYAAVLLFGFLEACCVPIPSEVTFGFAGVLAAEGHLNIVLVIVLGTVAELLGSLVSYSVGRVGGRPLVDRFGRYLLVTQADVDRAERFFAGRGAWAVPVGRALPFVRTFISIVAGFIAMPALEFGVLSLIGTAAWVTTISLVGYAVGGAWQSVSHGLSIAGYLIAAVVIAAIVAFVLYRLREFRRYGAEQALARAQAPASDPPGGGYSGGGQPRGGRPGGDYPGGDYPGGQPGGDYPGGDYPGGQPGGDYPGGDYPGGQPAGDYPGGDYPGGQPGGDYPPGGQPGGGQPGSGQPGGEHPGDGRPPGRRPGSHAKPRSPMS